MTIQPNKSKLFSPIQAITASVEALFEDIATELTGDQREDLRRLYEGTSALNRLLEEIVDNQGLQKVAAFGYLRNKFDEAILPMIANSQALLNAYDGELNDFQQQSVQSILNHSIELQHNIDQIWLFSSILQNEVRVKIEPIDLLSVFHQVVLPTHPTSQARFEKLLPLSIPIIHADAFIIRTCLEQVLANAVKFTHEGCIELSVTIDEKQIDCHIRDEGIGIAPQNIETVFQPYFQEHPDSMGMGLGLSIARLLLKPLKGTIDIMSAHPIGTIVTIVIPRTKP